MHGPTLALPIPNTPRLHLFWGSFSPISHTAALHGAASIFDSSSSFAISFQAFERRTRRLGKSQLLQVFASPFHHQCRVLCLWYLELGPRAVRPSRTTSHQRRKGKRKHFSCSVPVNLSGASFVSSLHQRRCRVRDGWSELHTLVITKGNL
jgi:hypothetical protein